MISTNYIKKLAFLPDAEERISLYLDSLFACYPQQKDTFDVQENSKKSAVSSVLRFTQKEIKNMAQSFKKVFIANGLAAHVLKKSSGKRSYCYEIRYRANGYDIRVSSTDLQKAKEKFLAKTTPKEIEKYKTKSIPCKRNEKYALHILFNEWLSLKKGTILDKEIKRFETNFNNLEQRLLKLDNEYKTKLSDDIYEKIIMVDHDSYLYLEERYGIKRIRTRIR